MFNDFFYLWLVVGIIFLLLEMSHPGLFFFLSFSLSALLTALFSPYQQFWVQTIIFLVGTIVAFMLLRLFIRQKHTFPASNIYNLIGKSVPITEANKDLFRVKIGGDIWTAKPIDETVELKKGDLVKVVEVKGCTVFVRKAR